MLDSELYEGNQNRAIMTAMIFSDDALRLIYPIWANDGFSSKILNLIASWCKKHYDECGAAPKYDILDHYNRWALTRTDGGGEDPVAKQINDCTAEFDSRRTPFDPQHMKNLAMTQFKRNRVAHLSGLLKQDVENRDFDKAEQRIARFSPMKDEEQEPIDVFQDMEKLKQCTNQSKAEPLITYPQGLGKFFGNSLRKGNLIAFMGPDKSGKSFWLMDIAYRAMVARQRVMYFEAGDMTEEQILIRFHVRNSGIPERPCSYIMPKSFVINDNCTDVEVDEVNCASQISYLKAKKKCELLAKTRIKSLKSYLKLSVHANSSLTVTDMRAIIEKEKKKGWKTDVVVVDYADILCPPPGIELTRDQTNAIWKQLRRMSQELDCLVVTASQSNAKAYKSEILDRSNFSEDKRKLAHVTGMIGINVSNSDREQGLTRLNWINLRDRPFNDRRLCYVAGCLALAKPAIISKF